MAIGNKCKLFLVAGVSAVSAIFAVVALVSAVNDHPDTITHVPYINAEHTITATYDTAAKKELTVQAIVDAYFAPRGQVEMWKEAKAESADEAVKDKVKTANAAYEKTIENMEKDTRYATQKLFQLYGWGEDKSRKDAKEFIDIAKKEAGKRSGAEIPLYNLYLNKLCPTQNDLSKMDDNLYAEVNADQKFVFQDSDKKADDKGYEARYGHCKICKQRSKGILAATVLGFLFCLGCAALALLRLFATACGCKCGDKMLRVLTIICGSFGSICLIAAFGASFACPMKYRDMLNDAGQADSKQLSEALGFWGVEVGTPIAGAGTLKSVEHELSPAPAACVALLIVAMLFQFFATAFNICIVTEEDDIDANKV